MQLEGIKMAWVAMLDDEQHLIADADKGLSKDGVLALDDSVYGVNKVSLNNLEGSSTKLYGNNSVQRVFTSQGTPEFQVTVNALSLDIENKLIGATNRTDGGGWYHADKKPTVAFLLQCSSIKEDSDIYIAMPASNVSITSQEANTNQDSVQYSSGVLTFSAISAKALNGKMLATYSTNDKNFNKTSMFAEVFGGYALPTSAGTNTSATTSTGSTSQAQSQSTAQ